MLPDEPESRALVLRAHNQRMLAEQRLTAAKLAYQLARHQLDETLRVATRALGITTGPATLSSVDEVLFTHPDLIDLDMADAFWRPR